MRYFLSLVSLLLCCLLSHGRGLSLYNYGLTEATSGEERFWVLYNAHVDALKKGSCVDYSNIKYLEIEIPVNAKTIPLTERMDFKGVTIKVKNTKKKDFVLFALNNKLTEVEVDKECFNTLDFNSVPELKQGHLLLVVQDETPWVNNRIGFNYGATRYDVLLLNDGNPCNSPISTYYNDVSQPRCSFARVTNNRKFFRNICFERDIYSTQKTFLLAIKNHNNIEVSRIKTITPHIETLYGDHIISFENCTNVRLNNIRVDNTYSLPDKWGYAFTLSNVWNVTVCDVIATADWGVFGNSNVNKAFIKDCTINRFDLHCYGRDFYFNNCTITSGIPISSFIGLMSFRKCKFVKTLPCHYRYDYNSYQPFTLTFDKCSFEMDSNHHCLMYFSKLSEEENNRLELQKKNLPNILVKDCDILLSDDLGSFDIVYMGKNNYSNPLGGMNNIDISGLKVYGECDEMRVVTTPVTTQSNVEVKIGKIVFDCDSKPRLLININNSLGQPAGVKVDKRLRNFIQIKEE